LPACSSTTANPRNQRTGNPELPGITPRAFNTLCPHRHPIRTGCTVKVQGGTPDLIPLTCGVVYAARVRGGSEAALTIGRRYLAVTLAGLRALACAAAEEVPPYPRLRQAVAKLRLTIASQPEEICDLRRQVTTETLQLVAGWLAVPS
jgi:hypothetical protein